MVCDYYIERYLAVDYKGGAKIKYELDFTHAYYPDVDIRDYDSEEEIDQEYYKQYEKVKNRLQQLCLMPKLPVIIYSNGKYENEKYERKYGPVIRQNVGNLQHVEMIIIKELRYEQSKYFEYHPDDLC